MRGPVSGLPAHPLSDADIRALDRHAVINTCIPVYRLSDEPTAIVVIALLTNDTIHFLSYNPENREWVHLFENDVSDPPSTGEIPDESDAHEQLLTHYDEKNLAPAGYPNDLVVRTLRGFPREPVATDQLSTLESHHPHLANVVPLMTRSSDGRTIALGLLFDDETRRKRAVSFVGFEPTLGAWKTIDTVESTSPNIDEAMDRLQTGFVEWIAARYATEEIHVIEDREWTVDEGSTGPPEPTR